MIPQHLQHSVHCKSAAFCEACVYDFRNRQFLHELSYAFSTVFDFLLVFFSSRIELKYLAHSLTYCVSQFPVLFLLFLLFVTHLHPLRSNFLGLLSGFRSGTTAALRAVLFGHLVHFFVEVSAETVFEGSVTFNDGASPGKTYLRCTLHSHDLPFIKYSDCFLIGAPNNPKQCNALYLP